MALRILVTGGTFDKEYDMITGELYFKETHLKEMLEVGRCTVPYQLQTLMMIDSLNMSDADRDTILHVVTNCKEEMIVITHGTDTMTVTAEHLAKANLPKTVVLTGAMIPYKFGSSDGFFNLGAALAFAQSLEHGVYVTMNGKAFGWDEVRKNRKTGYFERIEGS